MSQITSGRLIASHPRVKLDGVCDHAPPGALFVAVVERVLVGVGGGDAAFVGLAWFAVEVRVARLRGELDGAGLDVCGSSNSVG